ncbi:MAG: tail fiber protein [bacterium]|nr:tail fiber protein [bacterium]
MKKILCLSLLVVVVLAFVGCEAGLTSNDGNGSGLEDGAGFSFSDMYSRMNALEDKNERLSEEIERLNNGQTSTSTGLAGRIGELEEKADNFSLQMSPVGTIVAWHKNLAHTPALPEGWVECNGQLVSDEGSDYDGQNVPDLNNNDIFLKGSLESGNTGGNNGGHYHGMGSGADLNIAKSGSHTHPATQSFAYLRGLNPNVGGTGPEGYLHHSQTSSIMESATHSHPGSSIRGRIGNVSSGLDGNAAGSNMPKYYSVVWIMRIK